MEKGTDATPEETHSLLLERFRIFGPEDLEFRRLVEEGAGFSRKEAHSLLVHYFEMSGPEEPRFQYLAGMGIGFTSAEAHSLLVNFFRSLGPEDLRFRHLAEKGVDFTPGEHYALSLYFLLKGGPGSVRFQYLAGRFNHDKPLLIQHLDPNLNYSATRKDILQHIKKRSPVFVIERGDGPRFLGSQALFQVQSEHFRLLLSPKFGFKRKVLDPADNDFPGCDPDLMAAMKCMKESNIDVPVFSDLDYDDFTNTLVLNFCQGVSDHFSFVEPAGKTRLDCLLTILKASSVYSIFLLHQGVQDEIILELSRLERQGDISELVEMIKEDAPPDANILHRWVQGIA
ncbi:uncharacterized protein PV07_02629 [Cladophialophora immunda]|uniref:Uncharacterized protein n=1 Tax=Cladophialophora immunda TaxID=569365 RepID=A0A0D2CII9_9EURO|nr:uncharacterized protein PV07_02629 [Cladophialophora immunda]KIW30938.1 hypothetical protein PV07_02629 [Cladophialophora immunda]